MPIDDTTITPEQKYQMVKRFAEGLENTVRLQRERIDDLEARVVKLEAVSSKPRDSALEAPELVGAGAKK